MPNANGDITTTEVRRMKALAAEGMPDRQIAKIIGCGQSTVNQHLRAMKRGLTASSARYARFVELASAYVPTFGGGR